jgi:general secretion pathway protein N
VMQPDGSIELVSDALSITPSNAQGKLAATWRRFATKMSKVNPLGDYQLDAQLSSGPVSFKLSSPAGPLLIDGSGNWSATTRLNFDGSARLAPGAPAELANLVRLFGRDQGGGIYAISLKNF